MNRIWIVEMRHFTEEHHRPWRWYATVGVALSRAEGRHETADWQTRNPDDKFRLVSYTPEKRA